MNAWIQAHPFITGLLAWWLAIACILVAFSKCAGSRSWQEQSRELTPDEQLWFDALEAHRQWQERRGAA